MLFAICRVAQVKAGVSACEQALGTPAEQGTDELRQCLVHVETVREHLSRILLEWPSYIGLQADPDTFAELLALEREYCRVLDRNGDLFWVARKAQPPRLSILRATVGKIETIFERKLFGMASRQWLEIDDIDSLGEWARGGATPAARLLLQVMDSGWSHIGKCKFMPLSALSAELLNVEMNRSTFIERPTWDGACRETTSLSRSDSPLLRKLMQRHGNGLLPRLAARLTEIAQLAGKLLPGNPEFLEPRSTTLWGSPGLGSVEAARGQLIHRVILEGDRILDYRILAPTEWNFHPNGVVAQSLTTLSGDERQIRRKSRLLIEAVDPCVAYELSFRSL